MSRVKQWPVIVRPGGHPHPRRREETGKSGRGVGSPSAPSPAADRRTDKLRGARSTGVFEVPGDAVIQLVVAISSFSEDEQSAAVRIRRVSGTELRPVFFQARRVAPWGAERMVVDGLAGETVDVEVMLSSDRLIPTAAVTQFFPADGGILVLVYKSPDDFVAV